MKPLCLILFATLVSTICSTSFAAGSDELWEMKSTFKSGGQNMPMQSSKSCMAKGQTSPPVDKTCKVTNQGGLVGKMSAVIECPGPPPTTMKVEGTRTGTTMQGTMTVLGSGTGNVVMVQEFTAKVVGSCDAAEFAKHPQSGMSMGGGAPRGGMPGGAMPSLDSSALPSKRHSADAAASAGKDTTKDTPTDTASKTLDAAKKSLGGLLSF